MLVWIRMGIVESEKIGSYLGRKMVERIFNSV